MKIDSVIWLLAQIQIKKQRKTGFQKFFIWCLHKSLFFYTVSPDTKELSKAISSHDRFTLNCMVDKFSRYAVHHT